MSKVIYKIPFFLPFLDHLVPKSFIDGFQRGGDYWKDVSLKVARFEPFTEPLLGQIPVVTECNLVHPALECPTQQRYGD